MAQRKPGPRKSQIKIAKGARSSGPFATVDDAVAAIRRGEMVIVVDDEDRENEGDLTMAAEKVTPEAINFMAKHGRGLICLPMTGERLDKLEIPLMVERNSTRFETAFCVAIEAKRGTSTGISAADRAATVRAAINPQDETVGSRAARPHLSVAGARRRCAGAGGADRGGGRSGAHRRPDTGGRDLRNHERRRHDGARAGAHEVRQAAQAADDHDRRSDSLPHADRGPRRRRSRKPISRPSTARSACTASRA